MIEIPAVGRRPGLYVVELPERKRPVATLPARIKVGRSVNPSVRVLAYKEDGFTRVWISPPVSDFIGAELLALGLVAERFPGARIGDQECFAHLSFNEVVEIVSEAAARFAVLVPA